MAYGDDELILQSSAAAAAGVWWCSQQHCGVLSAERLDINTVSRLHAMFSPRHQDAPPHRPDRNTPIILCLQPHPMAILHRSALKPRYLDYTAKF